ncbi:MAG: 6,7-dimethyl-8-ribityllumazine synthase [Rhodobacteraceae bacterium]|nr:6,7-dimethyl-8-ribityllumazine synthase [Paracoccaceae bacterium]
MVKRNIFEGPRERIVPSLLKPDTLRVMIVSAIYYDEISDRLLTGAERLLSKADVEHETFEVPGALEIPTAIRLAHHAVGFSGYIALGCIIRGETSHYDVVCSESARGLTMLAQTPPGICIGNGILTVDTYSQALLRSNPDGADKGGDAAEAALALMTLEQSLAIGPYGY